MPDSSSEDVETQTVDSPDSSLCYPWEKEENNLCVLSCPDCDSDGDRIKDKVEVRYYANPVNGEDDPVNRIFQDGCPDYFHPGMFDGTTPQLMILKSMPVLGFIINLAETPADELGISVGLVHGIFSSLSDLVTGVVDLVVFTVEYNSEKIQRLATADDLLSTAIAEAGYDFHNGWEIIKTIAHAITNPSEVYDANKGDWFERRSDFAADLYTFKTDCNNVILTKSYTGGYGTGYLAAEVALWLIPISKVAKVGAVGKVAKGLDVVDDTADLVRFARMGKAARNGAKIIVEAGGGKWLASLSDDVAKEVAEAIGRISMKENNNVAEKIVSQIKNVPVNEKSNSLGRLSSLFENSRELTLDFKSINKKLNDYALNIDHVTGKNKAKVFQSVLGFNTENHEILAKQIISKFNIYETTNFRFSEYGLQFTQVIETEGVNGVKAKIVTGWIMEDNVIRLTTAYVK